MKSILAVLLLGVALGVPGFAQKVATPAPDFIPGGQWLNSEPLTIEALRGKVVLVNVWVYSCYNCYRSLPTLQGWHERFKGQGFEIIGVHTPEFESDKPLKNVQEALLREGVTWPVVQDNAAATWRAYDNSVWPTFYLIDRRGIVRRVQRGEISSVFPQGIKPLENSIKDLLVESR